MHEFRQLDVYDRVVEVSGGGKPTRYVLTHERGIPPTGELDLLIGHYDGCSANEARRLEAAGRQVTYYSEGTVLLVDGKPVRFFLQPREALDVDEILKSL
ncbi:MAG TPA: hypothetical protein VEA69_09400 [Tepidisphaeraceae bacterium]|nr:hypothetical protein [Tepidisphaeraceae bacterium]